MRLFLVSFLFFCISLNLNAVSVDELKAMSSEEKLSFFHQEKGEELDHHDDFIPALLVGLRDEDVKVQRTAASSIGRVIPMLQGMKANGTEIPFDLSSIPDLQDALFENLSNADASVRTASVKALVYSESPNRKIESSLIKSFENETEPRVKAHILQSLVSAGYDSDSLKETLLDAMEDNNPQVVSSAAKGIAELTPDGGLEVVVKHLSLDNFEYLRPIVGAIAAYGDSAKPYLPELNQMLENPSIGGTIIGDLERAITSIKNPSTLPARKSNKPVNLYVPVVEIPSVSHALELAEVVEEVIQPELAIGKHSEVAMPKPSREAPEQSSNWWLWLVGAVVGFGGLIVLVRRRC